jgi:hypothetical protein
LLLRRVGCTRLVAVAVPAVYALAPNYSTNRFWFAAFGYLLSIALWLVSLHADLQAATSSKPSRVWPWKGLAVAAFLAAGLGYEVVLPLALVNVGLAELHVRQRRGCSLRSRLGVGGWLAFHGATVAIAVAVAMYKSAAATGVGVENLPLHLGTLAAGAVITDFGSHLVGAPHMGWTMAPAAGTRGVALAAALGAALFWYLRAVAKAPQASPKGWLRMGVAGTFVYALGYAVFVTTERVGFSSTGIVNRVAAGATIGFSLTFVALMGYGSSIVPPGWVRRHVVPAAVAGLCLAGTVVNLGLASYWTQSWQVQQSVVARLQTSAREIPTDAAVLLAGVCPNLGPAPVFESHWDLAGALQIAYRDPSLQADIVTHRMSLEPVGVRTRIYDFQASYRYGPDLYLHDAARLRTVPLSDAPTARREVSNAHDPQCPPSRPGRGTLVMPFDRIRGLVEARVLYPLLEAG